MPPFVQFWIWISAFASLAGWTLSAFGQLNRSGYTLALVGFVAFIILTGRNSNHGKKKKFATSTFFLRFRRPLPLCFAVLAFLIFLSGIIYPPDNYTGLTYRVPRALQWLAHSHWFWIHTTNYRMNDRACGIEWLYTPLLLFTHSTRPLFLANFLPYLLLPGLTFSVLSRLGVKPRVAWQWMWLLPTGYNFLLQAGSAANDTFPTVYALAAVDFALRARQTKNFSDVAHSIVAAALLTGAKASNLPLLLPWAILLVTGDWWHVMRAPLLAVRLLLIVCLSAIVSFLPTAILNVIHCGDWSGAVLEPPIMTVKNPLVAITGNVFQFLLQNLSPPFFPPAVWWTNHSPQLFPHFLTSVSQHFDSGFFQLGEMPTEDSAGIGLGLSLLLAASLIAKFCFRRHQKPEAEATLWSIVRESPWISLLVYCAKSGMTTAARLISPYYPLLLPSLLTGGGVSQLARRKIWHVLVFCNLLVAFAELILTPPRPLWPAQTVLSQLAARHPDSRLLARAQNVYFIYSGRFDPLPGVRNLLPDNVTVVGFACGTDDSEISFWLPLGSRRVEDFLTTDSPEQIRKQGIEYAVINEAQLPPDGLTVDDWLKKSHAEIVATTQATLKIATGPITYYIVRFKP